MAAPYRTHDDVLARYPLRTVSMLTVGLGVSFVAVLLMGVRLAPYWEKAWAWALIAAAALVPILVASRVSYYRVAGGKGELRLYRDRIEVPHPTLGEPIRFALNELRIEILTSSTSVNGVIVSTSERLVLAGPNGRRELARDVFASSAALERVVRDIRCLQQGQDLPADDELGPARDKYDDALDEELDRLDR